MTVVRYSVIRGIKSFKQIRKSRAGHQSLYDGSRENVEMVSRNVPLSVASHCVHVKEDCHRENATAPYVRSTLQASEGVRLVVTIVHAQICPTMSVIASVNNTGMESRDTYHFHKARTREGST